MGRLHPPPAAWPILAAIVLATASPALAADAAKPPAPAAKSAKPADPDKPVCKVEEVTGSLVPKRVCRTQKQADAQRQATEDLAAERRELGSEINSGLSLTPSGPSRP